jgi:dynein light intermediate chain 1
VVLPPNWDSWGKIRVLREGFDVEGVNKGWSIDIEEPTLRRNVTTEPNIENQIPHDVEEGSALIVYEETIRDPTLDSRPTTDATSASKGLDVQSLDAQAFLGTQLEVLERIRHGADTSDRKDIGRKISQTGIETPEDSGIIEEGRVNEHIGPVQFNMGGIQVDADDMLKRLKDRQSEQTPDPETPDLGPPDGKAQNEALASFFAGLMKRGGGSAANSPKPGAS